MMGGLFFFMFMISFSYGMKYDFLLTNGPTYIPSNNSHYFPYGDPKSNIEVKLLQVDPYSGFWMMLLRGPPGSILGTHRHYGPVYGYVIIFQKVRTDPIPSLSIQKETVYDCLSHTVEQPLIIRLAIYIRLYLLWIW